HPRRRGRPERLRACHEPARRGHHPPAGHPRGLRHGRRPSRPPGALPAAARSRPVGQPCPAAEARRDGGDGRGPDPAARRRLQRPAPGPLPRSQPLAEDRHRPARRRRQLRGLTPMTSPTTSPRRARTARPKLDAIAAEAVRLATAATVAGPALLPGDDAILAPDWEPGSERLKPSAVGADDLLPYREQDERLEQGYEATGDEDEDQVALWELGLGRSRVLSPE